MRYFLAFLIITCSAVSSFAERLVDEEVEIQPVNENTYRNAEIIILNKITTKSIRQIISVEQPYYIADLSINLNQCVVNLENNISHEMMSLTILDIDSNKYKLLFNGWLFKDNLSINTFQHPVYEIIAVQCIKHIEEQNDDTN